MRARRLLASELLCRCRGGDAVAAGAAAHAEGRWQGLQVSRERRCFSVLAASKPLRAGPLVAPSQEQVGANFAAEEEQLYPNEEDEEEWQRAQQEVDSTLGEDHSDLMEFGTGAWPFLSKADEALSQVSAGEMWPFRASEEAKLDEFMSELQLSPLDLAVLARTAASPLQGATPEDRELLLRRLASAEAQALLPQCSPAVLATIVSSLQDLPPEAGCASLVRKAAGELLEQGDAMSLRHCLVLVSALGRSQGSRNAGKQPDVPPVPVLRAVAERLVAEHAAEGNLPDVADVILALEGLSRLQAMPFDTHRHELTLQVGVGLMPLLGHGAGMFRFLSSTSSLPQGGARNTALRLLAALASLPEVTGTSAAASWLCSLSGIRWGAASLMGHLPSPAEQETLAAAAFALARCGAWTSSRAGFLLAQALRPFAEQEKVKAWQVPRAPTELMSPAAGAWWLAAIAESGLSLDAATDKPEAEQKFAEHAEEALLGAAEALAADESASTGALARALWALCALGKASSEPSAALLQALSAADPGKFSAQTWTMLREMQASMPAGEEPSAESPWESEAWQQGLKQSLELERTRALPEQRAQELRAALEAALQAEAAEAAETDGDEDTSSGSSSSAAAPPAAEAEFNHVVGSYCLAMLVKSRGLAVDLDTHVSPMGRALRRQHWASLAGSEESPLRVAEISLAKWDEQGGVNQKELIQQALKGDNVE